MPNLKFKRQLEETRIINEKAVEESREKARAFVKARDKVEKEKVKFQPANEKRPSNENPAVKALLKKAGVPLLPKNELEELEVAAGDFVDWCKKSIRTKKFKQMLLDAAKNDKNILNRIIEYAIGKPAQTIAPPPGNGRMMIIWENELPTEPKKQIADTSLNNVQGIENLKEAQTLVEK